MLSQVQQRQKVIMDHYLSPRHRTDALSSAYQAEARSATCADYVKVGFDLTDKHLSNLSFMGSGCAVFTAATDLLLAALVNLTPSAALDLLADYEKLVKGEAINEPALAELQVLANVGKQFNRLNCALLGASAIRQALKLVTI